MDHEFLEPFIITQTPFDGTWISIEEIDVNLLDYDDNFSNWTDEIATKGHILFEVEFDSIKKAHIATLKIPVMNFYHNDQKRHYPTRSGQLSYDKDKIVLYDQYLIKYSIRIIDSILTLNIFNTYIDFKRVEN